MADRPVSATSGTLATALHTPLPVSDQASFLDPPRASYLESDTPGTPRDSYAPPSHNNSGPLISTVGKAEADGYPEEEPRPTKPKRRPLFFVLLGFVILAIIVLAVILPVYFTVIKPKQRSNQLGDTTGSSTNSTPPGNSPVGGGSGNNGSPKGATTGGDGSTILAEDGSTFTYNNKFGGFCKFP